MSMQKSPRFSFSIDRGGTFTDVYCEAEHVENGVTTIKRSVLKLLSEDPTNYADAPTEGIRRLLEKETGIPHPRAVPLDTSRIDTIRMGTTVATNALLERKGERVALITTKGFADLQFIGNQARPKIFDLEIKRPELLYEEVMEVDERVQLVKDDEEDTMDASQVVIGLSHERLYVTKALDETEVEARLRTILQMGIKSIAVVFLHSYAYPDHEKTVKTIAQRLGFEQISLSSEVMPMVRMVPRGCTTCVDAYLTPVIKRYLSSFARGFDSNLATNVSVLFMQSDGGLTPMENFLGNRAILSGPAGGVVGYARTSFDHNLIPSSTTAATTTSSNNRKDMPVIGFDMGGTSTDVSRYAGTYEHVFESTTAGVTIQSPQLDINTVAAGGGSRLFFRNGLFVVGPESAGAHPGPVCYRKGGPLAVTDANVLLGRIQPHLFPAIFGPSENEPLDVQGTQHAFEMLTKEINEHSDAIAAAANANATKPSVTSPTENTPNAAVATTANKDTIIPAKHYTVDEVAYGFIRVANEAMARPIRNLTTMKGFDVTKHALATFGGAGPQHCCAIAKSLGMRKIYVHRYAGILSAYGLSLADIVVEKQEPFSGEDITHASITIALDRLHALESAARSELKAQGFSDNQITCTRYLNLRYQGTDTAMMTSIKTESTTVSTKVGSVRDSVVTTSTPVVDEAPITSVSAIEGLGKAFACFKAGLIPDFTPDASKDGPLACPSGDRKHHHLDHPSVTHADMTTAMAYQREFVENYQREYGFELTGRNVLVDDVRVRAIGSTSSMSVDEGQSIVTNVPLPTPVETVSVYFEGQRLPTPVFVVEKLVPGQQISGPAIIVQNVATVVIEPNCTARIAFGGDIEITVEEGETKLVTSVLDPIYLSIFSHRFMGIAEQMGRTLQRTSISVNIKERLDFSCALFDPQGGLVANAPHLPVHLGAMSDAVRYQRKYWGDNIVEGDVLVSNHPQLAGGSHLPDITVITPIFIDHRIVFYVASRGHHADVGGIAPGSMPPLSKTLVEEGAAIVAFKLVEQGIFQETGISELLQAPGKLPNNFGTRNLSDNISDLKAQVAANRKGASLMQELVKEYGLVVVQAYMEHIQSCAEAAVRDMLRSFSLQEGMKEVDTVTAEDFLDDGTPIVLNITINRKLGTALFDFTGTGPEIYGNLNAPPAVTASAVIYCLRCLLPTSDIPLNQGVLTPVEIRIPPQSVLNPSAGAAVVGGNVQTSQRVTDVVLKAFKACAASQGCMNNLTFGDASMGYYETIAGGAGAGPHWHGCSAVHTHMTNTRITDPEILERRYPVLLRQFSVRHGSGGYGAYRGGDGVIREMEFTRPLTVSILSERRTFQPYGLCGGGPGARGLNLLTHGVDQRVVSLGGKNTVQVQRGDRLTIMTPGGGGYGDPSIEISTPTSSSSTTTDVPVRQSGSLQQYVMNQESV